MFALLPAPVLCLVEEFAAAEYDLRLCIGDPSAKPRLFRAEEWKARERSEGVNKSGGASGTPNPTYVVIHGVAFFALSGRRYGVPVAVESTSPFHYAGAPTCDGEAAATTYTISGAEAAAALVSLICGSYCVLPSERPASGFTVLCRSADLAGHRLRWLTVDRGSMTVTCARELLVPADDVLPLNSRVAQDSAEAPVLISSEGPGCLTTLTVCPKSGNVLASLVSGIDACDDGAAHIPLPSGLVLMLRRGITLHTPDTFASPSARLDVEALAVWVARGKGIVPVTLVVPCRSRLASKGTRALVVDVCNARERSEGVSGEAAIMVVRRTLELHCSPSAVSRSRVIQQGTHTRTLLIRAPHKSAHNYRYLRIDLDAAAGKEVKWSAETAEDPVAGVPVAIGLVRPDPGVHVVVAQALRQQERRIARR